MVEPSENATCVDVEADKSTAENVTLSSKQIADGIAALKAAADWPKEAITPKFNDKAATVYLNVVPKKLLGMAMLVIQLPHPLSLDRSVCYISEDLETEEQQAEMTLQLRSLGVLGKIKMIPKSLLDTAIANDDQDALAELPELYDTYLVCPKSHRLFEGSLEKSLSRKNKFTLETANETLENVLASTAMLVNSEFNGYRVTVGHTGLTDEQLQENIEAASNYFSQNREKYFPNGIASIKSIRIKTGSTKGIPIHQDNSVDVVEPNADWDADDAWDDGETLPKKSKRSGKKRPPNRLGKADYRAGWRR